MGYVSSMKLKDRVCLVTGSSRGIGRATALTFAKEGANVIINYLKNKQKAEEVADQITRLGRHTTIIQADISKKADVIKMVNQAINEFKRIDVLVNNVAQGAMSPNILEATEGDLRRTVEGTFYAPYYCVQAIAPQMMKRRYGKIINISANASLGTVGRTSGRAVAYAPAKAALNTLTKRLAYELGPYNINVNAIAPGLIDTDVLRIGRTEKELQEIFEEKARFSALRRNGMPQDIANAALFLASDESSFITGQLIVADGGRFDYLSHSI
jgi:3-oxoacyl-[acyl-carrier protein] reductase